LREQGKCVIGFASQRELSQLMRVRSGKAYAGVGPKPASK